MFGELEPEPVQVAFEATYGWSWFADLLADAGIPAHMAHPLATKAIGAGRLKNDAVDAKTLAHLLRTNLLLTLVFSALRDPGGCPGLSSPSPTNPFDPGALAVWHGLVLTAAFRLGPPRPHDHHESHID